MKTDTNPDQAEATTEEKFSADSAGTGAKAAKKAAKSPSPSAEAKTRQPLDPIEKPLWRLRRPDRIRQLMPFIGHEITVDRWFGRVAHMGDQTYKGTLLAVATTTTGSTADFLILKTVDGTVWAISTAQVYYLAKVEPPRKRTAAATEARVAKAAAARAKVKATDDVPDAA